MLQKTKSLLTKCLAFLFIVCCVVAATVGMAACSNETTIASIKLSDDGKQLIVTYTGKTDPEKIPLGAGADACKHTNTKDVELSVNGCDHHYLVICAECGKVAGDKTVAEHTWSEEAQSLPRKNCLIPERTAIVCTVCEAEKEGTVTFTGEVKEHKSTEVTYLFDKDHPTEACVCESKTIHANVCSVCNETLEVLDETPAPDHKFGDWAVGTIPNATTEGTIVRKCTVCGNRHIDTDDSSIYDVIPALYVLDDKGNATTTINPTYTYVEGEGNCCDAKGRDDEFTFLDPNGKTLSIKKNVKTEGLHVLVLDNKVTVIDTTKGAIEISDTYEGKLQYIGTSLTCEAEGQDGFFKCAECGNNIDIKVRKAHVAFDVTLQTEAQKSGSRAASCLVDGFNRYTCTGCNAEVDDPVAKLGHKLVCTEVIKPTETVTTWTFKLKCGRDGCTSTIENVVSEKAPDIKEVEATCEENAATVYSNIVVKNGDKEEVLKNDDGTLLEVRDEKTGTKLGHLNSVLNEVVEDGTSIDLRNVKAGAFEYIGNVTCGTNSQANPASGFFKCGRCSTNRPVTVYYSHNGQTKTTKYATCDEEGELLVIKCDDCKKENQTEKIAKLGHELVYTVNKDDTGAITTVYSTCIRVNKELVPATEEGQADTVNEKVCNKVFKYTDIVDAEVVSTATCQAYGKTKLTHSDGSTEVVNTAKTYCTLNGELMVCDYKHPYSPDKAGVAFTGSKDDITCKTFTETDKPNGFFKCDICEKWANIYLKKDHTKPANYDATKEEFYKAPTCTKAGYDKYTCAAAGCGESVDETIPALGHDMEWQLVEVNGLKATIAIRCKRTDCDGDLDASFEDILAKPVDYPGNIETLDLTEYFSHKNGKVSVDLDSAKAAGYSISTVVPGTCTTKGVYKVTLIVPESAGMKFDTAVTFEVTYDNEKVHVTTGSSISWVLDGYKYTGRYCTVCGNVVVTGAVKAN